MKAVETTLSDTTIRMRFADDKDDPQGSQSWIEFQLPLNELHTGASKFRTDGTPQSVAEVCQAALERVRTAINAESSRLSERVEAQVRLAHPTFVRSSKDSPSEE